MSNLYLNYALLTCTIIVIHTINIWLIILMNLLNSFNLIIFLLHTKMEKFIEVKKIDNFVFLQKTITNEQIYKLVKIHSQ